MVPFAHVLRSRILSFLLLFLISSCTAPAFANEFTVVSHPAKLQLPSGQPVERSPGSKPGSVVFCNRVHIKGVSRLRNLDKYANSLKVKAGFSLEDLSFRGPAFEICFHRNASIVVGMCPPGRWERVAKGYWAQSMSSYESKIIDIRMLQGLSSKFIEVSTEEGFLFHRIVFLITGIVMMVLARGLSESVVFYYGSAMAVGVILVVLMVLFQGMKLLPTGRKSSLAIFMYSSVVGVATFLMRYLSGLLRSILVEIGISEDMHNPLAIFLIVCFVLAGAWLGFWSVRKLVLAEDGSVDTSVAYFVEWTIIIFAAAMILESSLDTLLAAVALVFGMIITAVTRTSRKLRFLCRMYRRTAKWVYRNRSQNSPSKYSLTEYQYQNVKSVVGTDSPKPPVKPFGLASCNIPVTGRFSGSAKTPLKIPLEEEAYYSTFHNTPERKRFSKEEWKTFTRDSTKRAMEELLSSPNFGRWAAANADRITVAPPSPRNSDSDKVDRRFYWF